MLTRLIDWVIGCSYPEAPQSWRVMLLSITRCVVRFSLALFALWVLRQLGMIAINGI